MNGTLQNAVNSQSPSEKVEISVIIPVFDRRDYYLRAVKSVLNQTLRRDKYEILVIKNFEDPHIDSFLRMNGVISLYNKGISKSERVKEAFDISTGNIIAVLDDDDIFYENKLEEVYKYFTAYPDLKLLIHDCDFYYEDEEVDRRFIRRNRSYYEKYDLLHQREEMIIDGTPHEKQEKALLMRPGFVIPLNACFSRDVILGIEDMLVGGIFVIDVLPYYYTLIIKGKIIVTPKRLARYTVHQSAVHLDTVIPIKEYMNFKKNRSKIDVDDRVIHYRLVEGTLIEALERKAMFLNYLTLLIFGDLPENGEVIRVLKKEYPDSASVVLLKKLILFFSKCRSKSLRYTFIIALYIRYRVR
jgi:glycosyltransferase involved in cell wall biosynthesis